MSEASFFEDTSRRTIRRHRPGHRQLRAEMWAEQKGKCCYCGNATRLPDNREPSTLSVATVEHRISLANGGSDERYNLAISCAPCNNAKGDLNEAEFIEGGLVGYGNSNRLRGMTREMTRVAKRQRRQGRRPSLERERALHIGKTYVVMELSIRDIVQAVSAARYRVGGRLHGQPRSRLRWNARPRSLNEGVMALMERQIRRRVKKVSEARFPQSWGNDRLPKAAFDKSLVFTASMADFWPSHA